MKTLQVEIVNFADDANWRWRLLDEHGALLADHDVRLDRQDPEYEGFANLPSYLRWNGGGHGDETTLRRVSRWIEEHAWGSIAETIREFAEHDPVAVVIGVPGEAENLLFRPFEMPFTVGSSPSPADVSLIFDSQTSLGKERPPKESVGSALRILAIFSTPTDQVTLNTRFERRELRQLIKEVALTGNRAIELRVLQYGVTRELLEDILAQGQGWDIIHFSGHGLPAGLVLEHADGSADIIRGTDFANLLRTVRGKLKLVTLNSCESGAVAAAQAMATLDIPHSERLPSGGVSNDQDDSHSALPAVAQSVAEGIGCAVLAMRYPVEDEFAIGLTGTLYKALLEHGQPLSRALQMGLGKAIAAEVPYGTLSLSSPALFGSLAADLELEPPPGETSSFDAAATRLPYFEPEPEFFVGRTRGLARASAALAPKSRQRAVLFHGMAGSGKTACALELAYRHEENRFEAMAWHRAPTEGNSIRDSLANFAIDLEAQLEGLELAHVVDDLENLKRFLPRFRRLLAERSLLIVLDNVESLLTPNGEWRDERWGELVSAFISHDGLSRLVLTSRIPPQNLRDRAEVLFEPIDSLTVEESVLLARQLPNLGRLMESHESDRVIVRRTLEIVQGNPKLIELADRQAADAQRLEERINEADAAWSNHADLSAFFNTGEPDDQIGADDFLRVLERWTEEIAGRLEDDVRLTLQLLCSLEPSDRHLRLVELAWPPLWKELRPDATVPDFSSLLSTLGAEGLIDEEELGAGVLYRIHPAVEQSERKAISSEVQEESDAAMSAFWQSIFRQASIRHETTPATHAGLSGIPYLLRQGDIEETALILERVVTQNPHPNTIAAALAHLDRALEQAQDDRGRRRARMAIVRTHIIQNTRDVEAEIAELTELAREDDDQVGVLVLRGGLFNHLVAKGNLREAKELLEEPLEEPAAALRGPWSQMAEEARRLRVMLALGEYREVLDEAKELIERMNEMNEGEPEGEGGMVTMPWNVREATLGSAGSAARALEEFELSLELNEAVRASKVARSAPALELVKTDFNDFSSLLALDRLDEAEKLLQNVRQAAEEAREPHLLTTVLDAWASLERAKGRPADAIAFNIRALHVGYALGGASGLYACHHNTAINLAVVNAAPEQVLAHKLAEMLIRYQTETGYDSELEAFKEFLARSQGKGLPASFEELCRRLNEHAGVDFQLLFNRLPERAPDGDSALAIVVADANDLAPQGDG